ncbi:MAG TPA: isoprenylcysteine carboxylmethyltransferase family protein [Rhizomicrobium sp.]|nr:isoprenylcysteine carboxylmethyltransferase family protein [Rhizomicrobium sp.]
MSPLFAVAVAWIVWIVSWLVAALWADPATSRPGLGTEWPYRVITFAGAFLLFGAFRFPRYGFHLWHTEAAAAWICVTVAVLGFAFTWWARIHLSRLWSSSVTRKADHHVVDTGPYALVRHPIYTGMITALLATAALSGKTSAFLGAFIMIAGFVRKARLEESFLRDQLGAEAYDSYRRRVPMLVPFGPKSA